MPDPKTLRPLTAVLAVCAALLSVPALAQTTETPPADPGAT